MKRCFKYSLTNWCFRGYSSIVCIFIVLILIETVQPCTQVMQTCQNCFPNPDDECDTDFDSSSLPECTANLNASGITYVAYNEDNPEDERCWGFECDKNWRRSCCGSTTYRYGCAESGCVNVTLTFHSLNVVRSTVSPNDTFPSSSHSECMSYCIEMAFNGTACTSSYSSGTCKIYTGCPSGGCARTNTYSYSDLVDEAVCDGPISVSTGVCSELTAPTNGAITLSDNYNANSVATYSCDEGYTLSSGTFTKMCSGSGAWSPSSEPTCDAEVSSCSNLTVPTNGTIIFSDTVNVGSVASYYCDPGYTLSTANNNKTCLASYKWSPANAPTCNILTNCTPLIAPANGSVSYTDDLNLNSKAVYTCITGFILTNYTSKKCTSSGMWSSLIDPACVPEDSIPKPTIPQLFIMPCLCHGNSSFAGLTEEEIIEQLIKDTKIDDSKTTLAQQKLISAADPRASSKIIGSLGIVLICVIIAFCLLVDSISVYQKFFEKDK